MYCLTSATMSALAFTPLPRQRSAWAMASAMAYARISELGDTACVAGGVGGGLGDVVVCICMLKPSVAVMKQRLARSAFVASVQQSGGYRRRCIAKLM